MRSKWARMDAAGRIFFPSREIRVGIDRFGVGGHDEVCAAGQRHALVGGGNFEGQFE